MAEGTNAELIETQLSEMRKWINGEPHLPQNVEDFLLRRFVHSCYYDLEKAKTAAELFFTIRLSCPELLNNRDPLAPDMQKFLKIVYFGEMMISGNRRLWLWQLNDPGLESYDYLLDAKLFFMSFDAWLLANADSALQDEDLIIMDIKDISLKFLTKFNMSIAKKLGKYQGDAVPIRLKQIHLINAPGFVDKLYGLTKPFFSKEITEAIHFHSPNSTTLSKYFDKDDLPQDFGGSRPRLEEVTKRSTETLIKYRERLMDSSLWRATDKKSKSKKSEPAQTSTFRALDID